jgi:hypothetical protein
VDGDEKRSGAIAVCDSDTGDEAVTSGDVAPARVDGEPAERESAEDAPAGDASIETESSGQGDPAGADTVSEAPDEPVSDEPVSDEAASDEAASDEAASDEPVPDEAASDEPVPDEGELASDEAASDESEAGEPSASDDAEPDEHVSAEAGAPAVEEAVPGEPESAESTEVGTAEAGTVEVGADQTEPPAGRLRRLRPYLRRGAAALVAAGFVAVGVGAFAWAVPSPEAANQRFVEAAQSQGHVVAAGRQETLVISAARKICERRVTHETDQERRATALSSDEIAAVSTAFGTETRDFTTLALETFCSS